MEEVNMKSTKDLLIDQTEVDQIFDFERKDEEELKEP